MNTNELAGKVVTGGSKGICAAIARLMRRGSVVDIVERFQTQHALQEERETKDLPPSTSGTVAPGGPDKNAMAKIARKKESSPSHGGLSAGQLHASG